MTFTEKMDTGKTVTFGQEENGMYWGEIRGQDGCLESATTKKTSSDVWRWIEEREDDAI